MEVQREGLHSGLMTEALVLTGTGGGPRLVVDSGHGHLRFEDFYEANIECLVRALTATLGDVDLAQEAAAEAMTRACQRWSQIDGFDNPVGWCYRVALNWTRSRWRKRRRELVSDTVEVTGSYAAPSLADDRLTNALMNLTVNLRSVVVLRFLLDWTYDEIADALDVPRGTVASRLHRALEQLRGAVPRDTEASPATWAIAA